MEVARYTACLGFYYSCKAIPVR